jgi:hypothetical protein
MLNTLDMHKELENLKRRYAIIATELMDRAEKARSKVTDDAKPGSFSTHDAFNCAAQASELATLAGKIEQTENVIRWMADKAEV